MGVYLNLGTISNGFICKIMENKSSIERIMDAENGKSVISLHKIVCV